MSSNSKSWCLGKSSKNRSQDKSLRNLISRKKLQKADLKKKLQKSDLKTKLEKTISTIYRQLSLSACDAAAYRDQQNAVKSIWEIRNLAGYKSAVKEFVFL